MRKYLALLMLALIFTTAACKKKKDKLPTTMTVVVDKDTVWTTSNVTTDASNAGIIFISATSGDGNGSMDISLSNYNGAKGTFLVDYRGPGGNITGNTGTYRKGNEVTNARTGKIVVTAVTGTLITGTFNLYYSQTNITGSFSAPTH